MSTLSFARKTDGPSLSRRRPLALGARLSGGRPLDAQAVPGVQELKRSLLSGARMLWVWCLLVGYIRRFSSLLACLPTCRPSCLFVSLCVCVSSTITDRCRNTSARCIRLGPFRSNTPLGPPGSHFPGSRPLWHWTISALGCLGSRRGHSSARPATTGCASSRSLRLVTSSCTRLLSLFLLDSSVAWPLALVLKARDQ